MASDDKDKPPPEAPLPADEDHDETGRINRLLEAAIKSAPVRPAIISVDRKPIDRSLLRIAPEGCVRPPCSLAPSHRHPICGCMVLCERHSQELSKRSRQGFPVTRCPICG